MLYTVATELLIIVSFLHIIKYFYSAAGLTVRDLGWFPQTGFFSKKEQLLTMKYNKNVDINGLFFSWKIEPIVIDLLGTQTHQKVAVRLCLIAKPIDQL